MSEFDVSIETVLHHEGGLVEDPDDPGGATNYGLSLRYLRSIKDEDGDGWLDGDLDHDGDVDANDIRIMLLADAVEVYRTQWWYRYGYNHIRVQSLATKVLDLSINMGAGQAHKCLQRAARAVGFMLVDDGILGPKTFRAVNSVNPEQLLAAMRSEAAGVYRQIVARRPLSKKYIKGWLTRAYS